MITNAQAELARNNLFKAAKNLGFRVISPYLLKVGNTEVETFAYLPDYGSTNGTIVGLTSEPDFETDENIKNGAESNGIFYSFINVSLLLRFDIEFFRNMLADWKLVNS